MSSVFRNEHGVISEYVILWIMDPTENKTIRIKNLLGKFVRPSKKPFGDNPEIFTTPKNLDNLTRNESGQRMEKIKNIDIFTKGKHKCIRMEHFALSKIVWALNTVGEKIKFEIERNGKKVFCAPDFFTELYSLCVEIDECQHFNQCDRFLKYQNPRDKTLNTLIIRNGCYLLRLGVVRPYNINRGPRKGSIGFQSLSLKNNDGSPNVLTQECIWKSCEKSLIELNTIRMTNYLNGDFSGKILTYIVGTDMCDCECEAKDITNLIFGTVNSERESMIESRSFDVNIKNKMISSANVLNMRLKNIGWIPKIVTNIPLFEK